RAGATNACGVASVQVAEPAAGPPPATHPPRPVLRRAPRRRGLRPAEQHEIVAVDHFVAPLVAEETLDVARVPALDLVELRGAVVDEAARELAPVGAEAAHAVAHAEGANHPTSARR